ncbi:PREDICTED: uncharacterized protein LOC104700150 [Camelina sativa]|uniref:Uncharacterized protein LOC104700150 n=1 Tax=Camelina sativa TaxID=90675 RepID=A0ABM0SNR3_CAMSA|nr:PREDICTED: uncharacterized protein LOC104700150 [Camelina sativa]
MADTADLNRICNDLGVPREEALYYLEGLDWDFASAFEACRVKTLPFVKAKSSPTTTTKSLVTAKSTAEVSSSTRLTTTINQPCVLNQQVPFPSTQPRLFDSPRSSNPATGVSPEIKKERIDRFRDVAYGLSLEEIVAYLERFNWNIDAAVNHYFLQRESEETPYSSDDSDEDDDDDLHEMFDESCLQRIPEAYIPTLEGFSKDETSVALAAEMMERRGPPLPSLHLPSPLSSVGYQVGSSSSSFGLMDFDMPELHDVPITSSSQVQIQGSSKSSAQIKEDHPPPYKVDRICNETGVCRSEALYYLQGFDWDLASAMEACRRKTLPPLKATSLPVVSVNEVSVAPTSTPEVLNSRRISNALRIQPEQLPPKEDELLSDTKAESIKQFCEVTAVAPDFAVSYLESFKWNVQGAINSFMEEPERIIPSEAVTSKALPSQTQFQASGSSSSSFMNVDPTETKEPLEEASDESVPVAISPLESSQVDGNLKGSAVEEDSSTEAVLAAPNTITMTIILLDGKEAKIPFRFDQTVRDIRNAIDALRPDASRNYDLMSADSIEDLNTTVEKLSKGSTSLVQVQLD